MKNIILHKINGDIYSYRPYGICQDTSEIQNKIVQIVSPDLTDVNHEFSLVSGATILVTFTDINNTSNTTLNVNNTGAKPIFIGMNELKSSQTWVANDTIEFRYDGEHWIILNGSIKGTDYFTAADKNVIINQTETILEIQPNVLNVWDEVASLDITLATPNDTSIVNEYMVQFISGATATQLILPDTIEWMSEPIINANAIYQLSIINNLAVIGEWRNE